MPVIGGIKFFDLNLADGKTGATVTASSGQVGAAFILDRNNYTVWRSVGSDDMTVETLEIELSQSSTFNRLFLLCCNFKEFAIKYYSEVSGWIDFSNVVGVNGIESSSINETSYNENSTYYEFDEVTTDRVLILATKTQVANEEKFLNAFVINVELGTLIGYPDVKFVAKDKKLRRTILLNGRSFIDKSLEVFNFSIDFKNYAPEFNNDLNLIYRLFDRDDGFFIWLCGGRIGEPYFRYHLRGFRLEDLVFVQVINVFKDGYRKNTYSSMVDLKLQLEEV